jgi:hypothetical protein
VSFIVIRALAAPKPKRLLPGAISGGFTRVIQPSLRIGRAKGLIFVKISPFVAHDCPQDVGVPKHQLGSADAKNTAIWRYVVHPCDANEGSLLPEVASDHSVGLDALGSPMSREVRTTLIPFFARVRAVIRRFRIA